MLLHRDQPLTEERPSLRPEDLDQLRELPELPAGVVVPDDLSGLEPRPTRTSVRWMRWAVVLVLAVGAGVLVLLTRDSGGTTEYVQSPAAQMIQNEIDQALAELRVEQQTRAYYESLMPRQLPAYQIIQNEIDQALVEQRIASLATMSPAAGIIQSEIDHARIEQRVTAEIMAYYESLMPRQLPAYQIIQNEIDRALAEQSVEQQIRAYYADLAAALT